MTVERRPVQRMCHPPESKSPQVAIVRYPPLLAGSDHRLGGAERAGARSRSRTEPMLGR